MDTWPADFGITLNHLVTYFISTKLDNGYKTRGLYTANRRSCNLAQMRNDIVKEAQAQEASHLLFLDSDMYFPPETLNRLLAHDLPIVACNYVRRCDPPTPTAIRNGQLLHLYAPTTGLTEVEIAGTGVMLIRMDVFNELSKPYFLFEYLPDMDCISTDDVYFCKKARQAGIPIWIDNDLSHEIAHIGQYKYTFKTREGIN
jgi:hypothetical protein